MKNVLRMQVSRVLHGAYNHVTCLTKLHHIFKEELVPAALRECPPQFMVWEECLNHGTFLYLVGLDTYSWFEFALIFHEEKYTSLPKQGFSLVDAKMAKYPQKDAFPKLWIRVNSSITWGSCRLVFSLLDHVFILYWKWMKKKLWTCQKGVLGRLDQIEKFV